MKTIFFYLPEQYNHAMAAAELEHTLTFFLQRREVAHSTKNFWDDESGYAEYGVRVDISQSMDDERFLHMLGSIVYTTSMLYDSIRVQLDSNCTINH